MIPLHIHSNYSMMRGALPVSSIVRLAVNSGLKAIALTDYNGMYGIITFYKNCVEAGIKPILGSFVDEENDPSRNCILLARNNNGYSELCKIVTARKLNDDFSLKKIINRKSENLYVLTSSISLLNELENFPYLYAELYSTASSKTMMRKLYDYSSARKIKQVVTHPVYFEDEKGYETHKILTAIRLNKNYDTLEQGEITDPEFFFQDQLLIRKKWKALPDAIEASQRISDDCNVDLRLGNFKFPVYPLPGNTDSFTFLTEKSYAGFSERYPEQTAIASERLQMELGVIRDLNFSDYFLIVWDIVQEAKKRGMVTIGRGSAANSIVSYCLGLTEVDPIKYNLYFERFLNKARSTPPDVDIDFSWKERDAIVKYVFDRYGYDRVAMISTHVTFRARSAFREVAKVFGIPDREISRMSKFIPWTDASNLNKLPEMFPEARSLSFDTEPWKSIVDYAVKIANFPRHLSIHPGGIIITPTPITDYTALEYASNKGLGLIITQPDMYSIEDLGLIKIDLLSQRSLGVLRDTMNKLGGGQD